MHNATAITTGSANQWPNTPCIRLWIDVTFRGLEDSYISTLIYIGDQGIVYLFVGHVNRHWDAFAKRCINNRTIQHDAKGAVPIVYCLRKMHLWGSKLHADHPIPLRFYLGWSAFWGRCKKNSCPALLHFMTEGWRLLRWGLGVVPAITYHCNAVPVV